MREIKLYGYLTSPFVRKTAAFLYYKKLDFTHVPVNPINPSETIGFTGSTQVPVLEIDGEWKLESSDHAHWLDALFPERPLCPDLHRDRVLAIDQWVSDVFMPSLFRAALDHPKSLSVKFRFWRLAALVSAHTPLPEDIRHRWPDIVGRAPFIQAMGEGMDLSESAADLRLRVGMELAAHIGDGPFMGGFCEPTMVDLAVFSQVVFGYMAGLEENLSAAMHPVLKDWIARVAAYLPPNPVLIPDTMIVGDLKQVL